MNAGDDFGRSEPQLDASDFRGAEQIHAIMDHVLGEVRPASFPKKKLVERTGGQCKYRNRFRPTRITIESTWSAVRRKSLETSRW